MPLNYLNWYRTTLHPPFDPQIPMTFDHTKLQLVSNIYLPAHSWILVIDDVKLLCPYNLILLCPIILEFIWLTWLNFGLPTEVGLSFF